VTDARGRFRFPGVATGVYRVIVTGACDEVPLRVDVRPAEDQEIAVTAAFDCAAPERLADPAALPPGMHHEPWRVQLVERSQVGVPPMCIPRSGTVVWDQSWPRPAQTGVAGSPDLTDCDLQTLAPGAVPAKVGADWITLREDCFAPWNQQFTITAAGNLHALLIPDLGTTGGGSSVLRRHLCSGCVETFFDDLDHLDLTALTGEFESPAPLGPHCTIGGVIGGKPFLVRTSRLRLAPIEAARTRLLDLCAYRGCVDPGARAPIPVSITIDAPAEVRGGERFAVRARATVKPDVDVSGAVLAIEVAAKLVTGETAVSGILSAGSPLAIEAQYEAPYYTQGTIEIATLFAAENAVPEYPARHRETRTIRVRPR
jgi:hypothetical protein